MASSHKVCRLCLVGIDPQEVSQLNSNQQLTKSILHITGIEVASDSGQHEYLCNRCESELGQCVQFRTTCIHNNDIFKKMLHEGKTDPLPVATQQQENVEVEFLKVEVDIADEFHEKQSNSDPQDNDDGMDSHSDVENEDEGLIEPMVEEKVKEPRTRKKRKSKTDNDVPKTKKSYWKSRKNAHKVQCQQCGAMIAHYNLKSHQEIHNPNRRKLTCPHCPKEFICRKTYKIHVNAIHTQEIKYTCDKCGKVYLRPHSLKEHILASHTDEKRYQCKQCGERFPRSAMRNHHEKKVHSTARPFACEYCDKTFKFKTDFTVHTRIHTGEKPYKCDICGKCFNKSYNVVIHKKSHRND
ncbi:zinc finger protein 679 [Aedes aegypti]|uniref:Uncharacterized protein n=1 Tax=Aedes aegypti TaxID=7159 RepID=A0A1S4G203_AEDAE|nr:zinc finger protein 679 [Aedes aegypti]